VGSKTHSLCDVLKPELVFVVPGGTSGSGRRSRDLLPDYPIRMVGHAELADGTVTMHVLYQFRYTATWEHVCHLYFKRAKSSEVPSGTPWQHRELVAQRIGL
jgi:hypothetical protein